VPWGVGLIAIGVLLWAAPHGEPADAPRSGDHDTPWPHIGTTSWSDAPTSTASASSWSTSTLPPLVQPPKRRRYPVDGIGIVAALSFVLVATGGDALDWWDLPILGGVFVVLAILWGTHLLSGIVNRRWSVVPGLLLLGAITTGFLITQPDLDGGVGQERVHPLTVAEATVRQQLGIGRLTIDLTDVEDAADLDAYTVDAEVGVGRLHVIVPHGTVLEIRSRLGAGSIVVDGDEIVAGVQHDDARRDIPDDADPTVPYTDDGPMIVLDVEIGAGLISIDRAP